jgi:hypothetical protein
VRLREGQEDVGKLVSVQLGELGAEQPTLEESKWGGLMVECSVGQNSHRTTDSMEPTDDAITITEVLLPGHLFQEESHTLLKLLVEELGPLVIFEIRIDAIGFEHLVPLRRVGDTNGERKQAKVRRAVLTLRGWQLLGLLVILIPSVSEKELDGLVIEWSHIKAEILLFAIRNFKSKRDLDLIGLSGDIVAVQGH